MTRIAYVGGKFVSEEAASVSIFDAGFATGHMVVEVTRTFQQRPFLLDRHLHRLIEAASELRIDVPLSYEDLRDVTLRTLAANLETEESWVEWQTIHYLSGGLSQQFGILDAALESPTVAICAFPLTGRLSRSASAYVTGVDVIVPAQPAIPSTLLPPHIKSRGRLDLHLARLQAEETLPGSWAVLTTEDGWVTEGTGTNVFVVIDEIVITPRRSTVLPGITRDFVLETCREARISVDERNLHYDEFVAADEVFLTSTVVGLVHARSIDRRPIGDGAIGANTSVLRQLLMDKWGIDIAAHAARCSSAIRSRA